MKTVFLLGVGGGLLCAALVTGVYSSVAWAVSDKSITEMADDATALLERSRLIFIALIDPQDIPTILNQLNNLLDDTIKLKDEIQSAADSDLLDHRKATKITAFLTNGEARIQRVIDDLQSQPPITQDLDREFIWTIRVFSEVAGYLLMEIGESLKVLRDATTLSQLLAQQALEIQNIFSPPTYEFDGHEGFTQGSFALSVLTIIVKLAEFDMNVVDLFGKDEALWDPPWIIIDFHSRDRMRMALLACHDIVEWIRSDLGNDPPLGNYATRFSSCQAHIATVARILMRRIDEGMPDRISLSTIPNLSCRVDGQLWTRRAPESLQHLPNGVHIAVCTDNQGRNYLQKLVVLR